MFNPKIKKPKECAVCSSCGACGACLITPATTPLLAMLNVLGANVAYLI